MPRWGQLAWAIALLLVSLVCLAVYLFRNIPVISQSRQIPTLLPTYAGGSPIELGTPDPREIVKVGRPVEIAMPIEPQVNYTVESRHLEGTLGHWRTHFLTNPVAGRVVQLGDQNGVTVFAAEHPDYYLWFYLCATPCPSLKGGLYVYSVQRDENTLIAEHVLTSHDAIKIAEPWVTYVEPQSPGSATLRAYNIVTGESVLVADDLIRPLSYIGHYYALGEETIAWVSIQPERVGHKRLNVFSLTTHQSRSFDIQPDWRGYDSLRVSRGLILWRWDYAWKGYDLKHDALFTIPEVPEVAGVEIYHVEDIQPHENSVTWIASTFWGERAFAAPIIASEAGSASTPQP